MSAPFTSVALEAINGERHPPPPLADIDNGDEAESNTSEPIMTSAPINEIRGALIERFSSESRPVDDRTMRESLDKTPPLSEKLPVQLKDNGPSATNDRLSEHLALWNSAVVAEKAGRELESASRRSSNRDTSGS